MKVAYVVTFDVSRHIGIWQRMNEQVGEWALGSNEVHFVVCTGRQTNLDQFDSLGRFALHVVKGRSAAWASFGLLKQLKKIEPTVVYMRYNLPYPGMIAVARRWKTVLEVHSNDRAEWRIAPFRYRLLGVPLRNMLLRAASGMVLVDPDLADPGLYPHDIPRVIIPNGIRIEPLPQKTSLNSRAGRPQLVLVAGTRDPWQGIDKYLTLASLAPGFDFHVVGPESRPKGAPSNMVFHGFLDPEALRKLLSTVDIGVSNLALERINRRHPSPLKVREYLALGLPCIIAYDDPDICERPDVLNLGYGFLPNMETVRLMTEFVARWVGRACTEETRSLVDSTEKEKRRLQFLSKISESQ